jgi:hypothetical protein
MRKRLVCIALASILCFLAHGQLLFVTAWARKPPDPSGLPDSLSAPSLVKKASSISVTVLVVNELQKPLLPEVFTLSQNYPNPFNSSTIIEYTLPEAVWVKLEVYDILGRKVETLINGFQSPGFYTYRWKDRNHASGVYFYRIKAGPYRQSRKMLLLK